MDTPRRPITKTIGPVTFVDDYDWLQRDTPESLEWMWAVDAQARDAVQRWPGHASLVEAMGTVGGATEGFMRSPPRLLGGSWFWAAPSEQSPMRALWIGDAPGEGRVLVESAQLAGAQDDPATLVFNWFEPSPDGEYVLCGCTSRGAMVGTWRIVEVGTGKVLDAAEPCIAYTGAIPGWLPDASGYYLADRIEDGRHRVRFVSVKPGTAPRAERIFALDEIPADVSGVTIEISPDGSKAIALSGPHERTALMLGDLQCGRWSEFLPEHFEGECQGSWNGSDEYVARLHDDASPRGRVVAIPVATCRDASSWREVEPQGRHVLRAVTVVQRRIAVCDLMDCAVRFRLMDLDGGNAQQLPLGGHGGSMIAMVMRRFDRSDVLSFDYSSFVQRVTLFTCDAITGHPKVVGTAGARLDGIQVTQRFARSVDGVRIPYFLVHRADLDLSSPQPALITGYGGFNVALPPAPLAHMTPFVQAGGVYIHANLRGGAEYGKAWHESGRLACKWNVFADLFAIADQVIAEGITEPKKFAMMGGSNGGLLAGAAIVHRPDLWRVVVPVVPIFDQMEPLPRDPEFDPVRAIFLEDYGDPEHPVLGKVLFSYSPYHNVQAGTPYPAVFQVFGEKDLSCMPFHGRKFTAALRAATTSGQAVHLRVLKDTGHGSVDPAVAAEWLGFVMEQLGMEVASAAQPSRA
jgi:prolyl oligopeptidase